MDEMIEIQALENGVWEIQVIVPQSKNRMIKRGIRCRI
jgi:hypothetical protein